MRKLGVMLALGAGLTIAGCDDNGGVTEMTVVPLAYTRFVNAVPDTFGMDWRFVDALENSPGFMNIRFREFSPYQATAPGARKLRVFGSTAALINVPNTMEVATTIFADETITLTAGKYYTIVHHGYTRAGASPADRLIVIEDNIPAPGTNVAYRAMNLGTASVDVFTAASGGSTALPAAPTFANLAAGATSGYQSMAPGALNFRATAAGSRTPVLADANAPAGAAGSPVDNLTTIGGAAQPGSAFMAMYFPSAVVGSPADRGTAFRSPAWVYIVDRHPR